MDLRGIWLAAQARLMADPRKRDWTTARFGRARQWVGCAPVEIGSDGLFTLSDRATAPVWLMAPIAADLFMVPGPVMIDPPVDLVAWDPRAPQEWRLYSGIAEWLGEDAVMRANAPGIEGAPKPALRLCRTPDSYFQALGGVMADCALALSAKIAHLGRLVAQGYDPDRCPPPSPAGSEIVDWQAEAQTLACRLTPLDPAVRWRDLLWNVETAIAEDEDHAAQLHKDLRKLPPKPALPTVAFVQRRPDQSAAA